MPPVLHSPAISINWTEIQSEGIDTDVVRYPDSSLAVYAGISIDGVLYGAGYRFAMNFRIEEVSSGAVFDHLWTGNLDDFQSWGTSFYLVMWWNKAADAGVSNGLHRYSFEAIGAGGMYLYRPRFSVIAASYRLPFGWIANPDSGQFAVSDEHFFALAANYNL